MLSWRDVQIVDNRRAHQLLVPDRIGEEQVDITEWWLGVRGSIRVDDLGLAEGIRAFPDSRSGLLRTTHT